jgi:hypothetical protein
MNKYCLLWTLVFGFAFGIVLFSGSLINGYAYGIKWKYLHDEWEYEGFAKDSVHDGDWASTRYYKWYDFPHFAMQVHSRAHSEVADDKRRWGWAGMKFFNYFKIRPEPGEPSILPQNYGLTVYVSAKLTAKGEPPKGIAYTRFSASMRIRDASTNKLIGYGYLWKRLRDEYPEPPDPYEFGTYLSTYYMYEPLKANHKYKFEGRIYGCASLRDAGIAEVDAMGYFGDYGFRISRIRVEEIDVKVVPEPCTMLLMGTGLAGLAGIARRRRRRS